MSAADAWTLVLVVLFVAFAFALVPVDAWIKAQRAIVEDSRVVEDEARP